MTLRRPSGLVTGTFTCHWPKRSPLRYCPYGAVWVAVATSSRGRPSREIALAKREIERTARKHGLTFARWSITRHRDPYLRGYIWHVAGDFVWDEKYEATQSDSLVSNR